MLRPVAERPMVKILLSDEGKREAYITAHWQAIVKYASLTSLARGVSSRRWVARRGTQTLGKEHLLPIAHREVCGSRVNEEETGGAVSPMQPVCQPRR